jgi:hypothetical protein
MPATPTPCVRRAAGAALAVMAPAIAAALAMVAPAVVAALAMMALAGRPTLAQKTGALLHQTDSTRKNRSLFAEGASHEEAARRDTVFAALVFDPSLVAPTRSSAWTASVVPNGPTKEARIQANLCDIAGALCAGRGAASVMLAGPLNKDDDFTELADLYGLVGSARVQGSYTTNVTSAGSFYSFSGTFSQPSYAYRDTATLVRRSVSHTAYALEAGAGRRWSSVAVQGSLRWEQAYRPQTTQDVCGPASFGPPGTETCANMAVGEPATARRTVASLSGAWSIGGNGAARLTISHDLRHGVTGIDLPVWVLANAAGGLAGGVRFGYRTDARQVTVLLFVSEFKL